MTTHRMTAPRSFALGMVAAVPLFFMTAAACAPDPETPSTTPEETATLPFAEPGMVPTNPNAGPATPAPINEDDPGWDCRTMGNFKCGATDAQGHTVILDWSTMTFTAN